ncbi:L-ornithine N(5)-monooxygenase [Pseudomonas fluorescens]|uniref:L-ornithine N(5)-monooxygenase n=1 Tax=Pseudomonas fluorescens TaxID=294 RepID=A0A5E7FE65_PSEFL|nr:L-ornithine N(5)-monooxygenase [Pseudomonas fluorescens]
MEKATATEQGVQLAVRNNATGELNVRHYDAVVLATGYERQMHRKLLAPLEAWLGDFEVDRNYRLLTDSRCKAGIYMQGFCQASHGLSDTLLSVLPIRADEIATSQYEHGKARGQSRSVRDLLLATAS